MTDQFTRTDQLTRSTIYERLRKRSYRRWGGEHGNVLFKKPGSRHQYYLQGVRDALRAVREDGM